MSQVRKNGLPAYQRIQGTIVKRLETGLLKPGDLVDSERELARIHGVSLMTARHALTTLWNARGWWCGAAVRVRLSRHPKSISTS